LPQGDPSQYQSQHVFASIRSHARLVGKACKHNIPYRCFNVSARRAAHRPRQAIGLPSASATRAGIDLPAQGKWPCGL